MFECWTADRVGKSFLFLTSCKLSHVSKTKFVENEKRVLKKKTSIKKEKKKKKRENLSPTRFELAPLDAKDREKNTELTHATTPAGADELGLKQVHIPSLQWLTVFRYKFFVFYTTTEYLTELD